MTTSKPFISPCKQLASFATLRLPKDSLLIVDRRLRSVLPQKLLREHQVLWVSAGESLKALERFPGHMKDILKLAGRLKKETMTVVAIGGGSVGDFAGFVASVLYRGVPFVNIPSTWLAAVDAAHGGKTALNVGGAKNQLGVFHPARRIYLVKSLLLQQPRSLAEDAYFEFFKMALLTRKPWGSEFLKRASPEFLWNYLKPAIDEKNRVVAQDPYERLGKRQILNLGHTLGHTLEAAYALPHGLAVGYGLDFAIWLSAQRGYLPVKEAAYLRHQLLPHLPARSWAVGRLSSYLKKDKKRVGTGSVGFVFLEKRGQPVVKEVGLVELRRQLSRYFS